MNQDTKERVLSTVNVHVGLAPIPHLDLTSEAEKLQIKEKATEEGCKNIPLSDSTNPLNDYEATITHHVSEYCLSLQSIFENRIHHLKTSIDEDDTDIVACEKSVRLIPEEFVQNARHLLSDRAPEMQRVTERRSSRRQEYKEFCQENRLKRVAKVPETINSILQILSLIVIVIVDTFANSTFFASGLENGLIGGIIIAFLAATSNAFYCFFLGLASKNIFHVNPTKRVLGWLALISAILGSACIAVSVGHYRDALQISPDNAAVLALQNLSNSPLDLVDIQSYFLAFLTLAFGTTSLIDGIFWKDLYPGFTEITNGELSNQVQSY